MIAPECGIGAEPSYGSEDPLGSCVGHASSGSAKATADVHCDVMAASTTSLHPWPTPDANINRAASGELMGDAPTAPAYVDNSLKKSTSPDSSTTTSATERNRKRQRNTEAARRYRQRKVDRTAELEEALAAVSRERDELRLKLARSEAEAEVLRRMVRN